jgi:Flp pilus assembly protein TadD
MIVLRAAIVVLAVAVIAWCVDGIAATRAQDRLGALVASSAHPGPAALRRADGLAARAQRRSFDRRALLLAATLRLKAGDAAGAERVLKRAVADEPVNGEAWQLLADAAQGRDPALARRALARVRQLAPPVPAP